MSLPVTQVSPNDLARRLYIGNLYYELKEEDIRNTFSPFGAIKSIDLSLEPGYVGYRILCTMTTRAVDVTVLMTTWTCILRRHGRSKGFCFLEYDGVQPFFALFLLVPAFSSPTH